MQAGQAPVLFDELLRTFQSEKDIDVDGFMCATMCVCVSLFRYIYVKSMLSSKCVRRYKQLKNEEMSPSTKDYAGC